MNPLHPAGASPHRPASPSTSNARTASPRAVDGARAKELGAAFAAQIEQSMVDALAGLGAEEPEDGESSAEGEMGGFEQTLSGANGLGGSDLAGAGAGAEAALARQLLAIYTPPSAAAVAAPAGSRDARANAAVVADVARQHGVDPVAAVAMMLVESGGNSGAVGDGGTSFGLFQLHQGGMLTSAGLTPEQAFDPRVNAGVSLRALAHETRKGPNRSPGEIAAASQRPADPAGYARKVDAAMDRARALLA